ncbi:hypothetical protein [Rhizobium sp. YTU87027]|uniref:hypothetical protein n=1 Tax=Rhizobium sp. YTU87027 TaxID=3417741 RepID=UPI003D687AE8
MAKKPAEKSTMPSAAVVALSLIDVDLAFDPTFEDADEVALHYHIQITPPKETDESIYAFTAQVEISKAEKDSSEARTSIGARYFCGIRCRNMTDKDIVANARKYTQTTVWGNFASLASIVAQQMRAQFPPLPPVGGRVEVKEEEDEATESAASA